MSKKSKQHGHIIELNSEGEAPKQIQLLPAGEVHGRDGRWWLNNEPERILEAFKVYDGPLSIDYEHANDLVVGEPIPSAGWINDLLIKNGEVWGDVEWTPKAKQMIEDKEYRFTSPVFYSDGSNVIVEIIGAV